MFAFGVGLGDRHMGRKKKEAWKVFVLALGSRWIWGAMMILGYALDVQNPGVSELTFR